MNDEEIAEFVKSRDEALIDFVMTDNMEKLKAHMKKYEMWLPEDSDVLKAGIYKAVQECTAIPKKVKKTAMEKCIKLGFKPFIDWDHC